MHHSLIYFRISSGSALGQPHHLSRLEGCADLSHRASSFSLHEPRPQCGPIAAGKRLRDLPIRLEHLLSPVERKESAIRPWSERVFACNHRTFKAGRTPTRWTQIDRAHFGLAGERGLAGDSEIALLHGFCEHCNDAAALRCRMASRSSTRFIRSMKAAPSFGRATRRLNRRFRNMGRARRAIRPTRGTRARSTICCKAATMSCAIGSIRTSRAVLR